MVDISLCRQLISSKIISKQTQSLGLMYCLWVSKDCLKLSHTALITKQLLMMVQIGIRMLCCTFELIMLSYSASPLEASCRVDCEMSWKLSMMCSQSELDDLTQLFFIWKNLKDAMQSSSMLRMLFSFLTTLSNSKLRLFYKIACMSSPVSFASNVKILVCKSLT